MAFQDSYGIKADGVCDEATWSALIESSWSLGDRVLYHRTPSIRGDDVAELQGMLNRLGFDCGRVDGVFGPLAAKAVTDFQLNMGAPANGVVTSDMVRSLRTVSAQTGDGPGIAVVREGVALSSATSSDERIVMVGHFTGVGAVAVQAQRRLRERLPNTRFVDGDSLAQATAANGENASVYVGLEAAEGDACVIYYYEVPNFVSVGGRNLAFRIAEAITTAVPEFTADAVGIRHPVLRATKMPAVLCALGPSVLCNQKAAALSRAITDAVDNWFLNPLS